MLDTADAVVVRRGPAAGSEREAQRLVEHLRRLAVVSDPHLVPVAGVYLDGAAVTAVFRPGPGRSLRELLGEGPAAAPQAVALGLELLAGLAALQGNGLGHGALDRDNVHVGPEGRVRLMGYGLQLRLRAGAARPAWPDPRNDLVAAGQLICELLNVPPAADPRQPLRDAERVAPAVVAAARGLAGGRYRSAPAAIVSVRSAAGIMSGEAQVRRQLALLGAAAWPRQPTRAPVARTRVPALAAPMTAVSRSPARPGKARGLAAAGLLALLLGAGLLAASLVQAAAPQSRAVQPPPLAITALAPAGSTLDAGSADTPSSPPSGTDSPTGAVSDFYQRVQQHRFAAAIQLWTARLRAASTPDDELTQRFASTTSLRLISARVSSEGPGTAVVAVELEEVRDGRTYRWVGSWTLVYGSSGWQLDQPALSPGQAGP